MRVLRRRLVGLACFCLSMTVFLASSDQVYGQSGGPSADQIQMFQNLTPDQQQAILQSLGGAGGLGGGAIRVSGLVICAPAATTPLRSPAAASWKKLRMICCRCCCGCCWRFLFLLFLLSSPEVLPKATGICFLFMLRDGPCLMNR